MCKINEIMQRFFCMLHIAWLSCRHCFIVAWRQRSNKASRRFVTKHLRQCSQKILARSKSSYQLIAEHREYAAGDTPLIFMSNHQSQFDSLLIFSLLPQHIRMVLKRELTKIPFFGQAAVASEQVIIERDKPENRPAFYQKATEKLKSGIAVWVFPEGTRSKTGKLLPFKLGGFRLAQLSGALIIPVGIIGTRQVLPVGKLMPNFHQKLELRIGKPIDSTLFSLDALQELAQQTEYAIQQLISN